MNKGHKRYLSIKTKLSTVILSVLILAIIVNSVINIFSFRSAYKEALEEKSYAVGQSLRKTIYKNLRYFPLDSFAEMDAYLDSVLEANKGISYCFITDRKGQILYHSDSSRRNFFVDKQRYFNLYPLKTSQRTTLPIGQYYESIIPVIWGDELVGAIHIGIQQEIINSKIRNMQIQSLTVLIVALAFCIFFFYHSLSRIIIIPISQLLDAIRDIISRKKFERHIEVKSKDEISTLASLFNEMTDELKKYYSELHTKTQELEQEIVQRKRVEEELQRHQDHLEELVKERTAELRKEIIERKRIEEELREAMEAKSKLTSMVSHELRTPLAAIKTGINLVLDGLAGDTNSEQKDLLDTARRNVNRLARLINDVLDFQKLEAGRMEFRFEKNDLNEVIRDIYKAMRSLAERKGLQFNLELQDNLAKFNFDKDRIIQVVENLVSNAIKFTREGQIKIVTFKKDADVQVEVFDTGIGIKKEDMLKLFHSFEQLGRARSGRIEGTGLGLAICREIIERHKGRIWAESAGENKGTTFIFTLPFIRKG